MSEYKHARRMLKMFNTCKMHVKYATHARRMFYNVRYMQVACNTMFNKCNVFFYMQNSCCIYSHIAVTMLLMCRINGIQLSTRRNSDVPMHVP